MAPQSLRTSGFHGRETAAGADFIRYGECLVPDHYPAGALAEYWSCRRAAGVMDMTCQHKIAVAGPQAGVLLQAAATRDLLRLSPGRVCLTTLCNDMGLLIDVGTLFCLSRDHYWFVGDSPASTQWLEELAGRFHLEELRIASLDRALHTLSVQGPASRSILLNHLKCRGHEPAIVGVNLFSHTMTDTPDGGAPGISRTGYSGELGYELWCHPEEAPSLWDSLAVGRPGGPTPVGLQAIDMLRIEAGLPFLGLDYDSHSDPFEAGLEAAVDRFKDHPFIGRDALAKRARRGRRLVGLQLDDPDAPLERNDTVLLKNYSIGEVTSSAYSPLLGAKLALARISPGIRAGVKVRIALSANSGRMERATITPRRRYDPDRRRIRA